jgi:hypothetical protein
MSYRSIADAYIRSAKKTRVNNEEITVIVDCNSCCSLEQAIEDNHYKCFDYVLMSNQLNLTPSLTLVTTKDDNILFLKYLISNGCPLHQGVLISSIEYQSVRCIKYLLNERFDIDNREIVVNLVKFGNTNLIKLAVDNGYHVPDDITTYLHHDLEVLKFLVRNLKFSVSNETIRQAIDKEMWHHFTYASDCFALQIANHPNEYQWDSTLYINAGKASKYNYVKELIKRNCTYNSDIISVLLTEKKDNKYKKITEIIDEFIIKRKIPLDEKTVEACIKYQMPYYFEYLVDQNCPIDVNLCLKYGKFKLIKYIAKNRNITFDNDSINHAIRSKSMKCFNYVIRRINTIHRDALYNACIIGNFEMIQMLVNKKATFEDRCMLELSKHKNIEMLEYAYQNGCRRFNINTYRNFIKYNDINGLYFSLQHGSEYDPINLLKFIDRNLPLNDDPISGILSDLINFILPENNIIIRYIFYNKGIPTVIPRLFALLNRLNLN